MVVQRGRGVVHMTTMPWKHAGLTFQQQWWVAIVAGVVAVALWLVYTVWFVPTS
jgi:hypothetical protein